MRFPYKVVRNPKLPHIDRKLDLIPFFTFKNGRQIYTYKIEDLSHISGRYLDQVKNTINFMIQYNAGPDQVKSFCKAIQGFAKDGLDGKIDKTDALIKTHSYAEEMPKLAEYVEDLELKLWHDLYILFFVVDSEPELLFTPKQNALKLELLNTCTPEEQEVFFSHLKTIIASCSDIYRSDILDSSIQMAQQQELLDSLINPMRKVSSQFNVPSTEA